MSIQEAPREALGVGGLVDGRICPPEQVIDWQTRALSPKEVALVNHVHGLLGDYIMGPEEVKIAIGIKTLGEIQAFREGAQQETEQQSDERPFLDGMSFGMAVIRVDRKMSDGLATTIDNLQFADKWAEIVPEVVERFSRDIPFPDGVVEDLSALEVQRAIVRQATREGVARTLPLSLELYLDKLMGNRRWDGNSPEVTLEVRGSGEEVSGRLRRVHHDLDGVDWLEIEGDAGTQRISHNTVKTLGIAVTRTEVEDTVEEATPDPSQPRRKGLFRR